VSGVTVPDGTGASAVAASALYPEAQPAADGRLPVLDGWRALSILLVLAGHWLPLNAVIPNSNAPTAATGMAIFFTLSGFLITVFLWRRPDIRPFLIRRLLRIVPLAWAAMLILYLLDPARPTAALLANLLFFSNLPPAQLLPGGEHLWSLCVEMQFYLGVALLVAVLGRRGLLLLPVLALLVTAARIVAGEKISIVTWHRVDEILAGATIALLYLGAFGQRLPALFARMNFWVVLAVAAICCYFYESPLSYARPYAVAALVGITLWHVPAWIGALLRSRPAAYVAEVSYAVYVVHGILGHSWLGTGDLLEKYAKRPLLIAATFAIAHLSTFFFEKRFITLAKRLTASPRQPRALEGA
jgi:peptidoglycan/LPS O-acetylase OafA/YrhL